MVEAPIIFVAAGDLATRTLAKIQAREGAAMRKLVAIARRAKTWVGAEAWQGDIASNEMLAKVVAAKPSVLVVTLVPNGDGEAGYIRGYLEPLQALMAALQKAEQTPLIIFASSTGVYHQMAGEWVDEQSATEPTTYSGQCLLACEQSLQASGLPYCCVRFGGIYGPGRDFLIRQVKAGKGGGDDYGNRIHSEDAAGILALLITRHLAGLPPVPILVACDNRPATSREVRTYIAQQLGMDTQQLQASTASRGGHKRCRSQLLLALGYRLLFPSFIEGYKNAGAADSAIHPL